MENSKLQEIQVKLNALEKEKIIAEGRMSELTAQRQQHLERLKEHNIETPQQLTEALSNLDADVDALEKEINQLINTLPEDIKNKINEQTSINY